MIVYDGIYRLPKETAHDLTPRSKWAYAWQVRIINLDLNPTAVRHIKPMIVTVKQTGSKICFTSCAEGIGKKVSRDFNLNISRVLWVEHFPNHQKQWFIAEFKPKSIFGPEITYHIKWRPIRPNEVALINPFIPEIDTEI